MEVGHYEGFRALAVLRRGDHVAVEAHVEDWRSKIFGLVGSRDGIDEGRRPAGVRALNGAEGIADGGACVAAVRRCGDVGAFVRICREEVDERNVGAMRERTRVDGVRYFVDDALRQRIRFGVVVAELRHGENLREQGVVAFEIVFQGLVQFGDGERRLAFVCAADDDESVDGVREAENADEAAFVTRTAGVEFAHVVDAIFHEERADEIRLVERRHFVAGFTAADDLPCLFADVRHEAIVKIVKGAVAERRGGENFEGVEVAVRGADVGFAHDHELRATAEGEAVVVLFRDVPDRA